MKLWKNIWKDPKINLQITWNEAVIDGQEAGKQVVKLAQALYEHKSDLEIAPLIGNICSLLDVLNFPLVEIPTITVPFVALATGILNLITQKTQADPSLESCLILGSQAAYLESLRQFLQQHPEMEEKFGIPAPASPAVARQIQKLGEKLEVNGKEIELELQEAENTLVCFHQSKLAKAFNLVLLARLQESGLRLEEAKIVTERICRSTHRYLERIFIEVKDSIPRLTAIYEDTWQQDLEAYLSIDAYLEKVIAKKPWAYSLDERFTFNDIYLPLEIKPLKKDGQVNHHANARNIESWAQATLLDRKKQGQVLFIQAGTGMGKSLFCRMFADRVRRELHPVWTPILIRLRDIKTLHSNFERVLESVLGWNFVKHDRDWLTSRNTRFLFLLDGFDDLPLVRGFNQDLKLFLEQLGSFQMRCQQNSKLGHRVLITGRPLTLYGIERLIPSNFERVEIIPMSQKIQEQWFNKWEALVNIEPGLAQTDTFRELLQDANCPDRLNTLAGQPLLLYLLSALHQDNPLSLEAFKNISIAKAKSTIYQQAADWLLKKQIDEFESNLDLKIGDREDLHIILAEAGLCAVQSGREYACISALEHRLQENEHQLAAALIEKVQQHSPEKPLKNSLATFHFNSIAGTENSVEFCHKSFGEFFCADRLLESLQEWTKQTQRRGKPHAISTKRLDWEIYDLFGYGSLTPEIVEYLMGLLEKTQVDLVLLFDRLNKFYLRWSEGKYIEASEDTLPQKKARQLQQQKIQRGQREVDIYTGLNVLILLLELNRYAQSREDLQEKIVFYLCGQENTKSFDRTRLLRVISYSQSLEAFGFNQRLGRFLQGANLSESIFQGADLRGFDLRDAVLRGTDLKIADLRGSNLQGANLKAVDLTNAVLRNANLNSTDLTGADLSSADLRSAKLHGALLVRVCFSDADLSGADLTGAILSGVDFSGADLSGVDFRDANLKDIEWDSETKWTNVIGLKTVSGQPVII